MKRNIMALVALLLVLAMSMQLGWAFGEGASGGLGEDVIIREPLEGNSPLREIHVYSCTEQDFSFQYAGSCSTEWDDESGATVYVNSKGYIPYVLVWRQKQSRPVTPKMIETYFEHYTEEMADEYGDHLIGIGDYQEYTFDDVKASGVKYVYLAGGTTIEMLRLLYALGDSVVVYTAKYEPEKTVQMNRTYEVLSHIMQTFQPDAHYYDDDHIGSEPQRPANSEPQNAPLTSLGAYSVEKNKPLTLQTALFDGGFFSFECPVGWHIETVGAYTNFGFKAYDPQVPERMIFFYGKYEFFNKSDAAKQMFQQMASVSMSMGGFMYVLSAAVPALDPPTTANFYAVYPDFMNVLYQTGVTYPYPVINDLFVMEVFPNSTFTTPGCMDNSIVRASFRSGNNVLCEGLLAGQVTNSYSYMVGGVDLGMYCVYDAMGVSAPAAEFPELHDTLTRCLSTFTFTQEYVQAAVQNAQQQTDAILANGRTLQAASDSYNAAWSARQTSYDIISQKNSDATLGYERLYDPDTGEVYRAELGFYDQYDINRGGFSNPRLQIIDDSTSQYYLKGVDYTIHR